MDGRINGFLGSRYGGGKGIAAGAEEEADSGVTVDIVKSPLPHYLPQATSAAWRVTTPTSSSASGGKSEGEGDGELASSYYRRALVIVGAESSRFAAGNGSMPLPSTATRVGSSNDGSPSSGVSPSNAADKRQTRRDLSKEQREHAAAMRRLGACDILPMSSRAYHYPVYDQYLGPVTFKLSLASGLLTKPTSGLRSAVEPSKG